MSIWKLVVVSAIAVLSLVAGIPKIIRMHQEIEFPAVINFTPALITLLGVFQVTGGLLMTVTGTRKIGAYLAGLSFLVSAVAIFTVGHVAFGILSLLPVVLILLILMWVRGTRYVSDA